MVVTPWRFTQFWRCAFIFVIVGCFAWGSGSEQKGSAPVTMTHGFDRVLIIVLENQNYEDAIVDP